MNNMSNLQELLSDQTPKEQAYIGELLIAENLLSEAQLQEAIDHQNIHGGLLGQILIEKGHIEEHDIMRVIGHQIGIDFVADLNIDEVDPNITNNIPINYAKANNVIPILETIDSVNVLLEDPFNEDVLNDLHEIFKKEIKISLSSPAIIQNAINKIYERASGNLVDSLEDEFDESMDLEGPIDILDASEDEAPVKRFVNSIIFQAVKDKASDIHIEPYEKDVVYRYRINGVMREKLRQPLKTQAAVSSRIKVMAKLDIAEKRLPQDGRIKIKMAGKDIDIRLSTVPVQNGERIVMRVLEKSEKILGSKH